MKYNPDSQHRRSIRLKGYDYSQNGFYFITICSFEKQLSFGAIINNDPILGNHNIPYQLNEAGKIIKSQWYELTERYSNIALDQFAIMPDHIHGIIIIKGTEISQIHADYNRAEQSPAPTLGDIICAYKSISTKIYNKQDSVKGRRIWQRNYHEHIIRNTQELNDIRRYIKHNPKNWYKDEHIIFESFE